MKRAEAAAALVLMGVAIFVCNGAVKLSLGTPSEPGPGFLPFWTGALMGCLALLHLIRSVLPRGGSAESGGLGVEEKWHRAAAVVASILGYALILPHVGYLLTTFLLMVVLFSLYRRMRWWVVVGWSVAVIGVTYLVFHGWLKIPFPVGVLG